MEDETAADSEVLTCRKKIGRVYITSIKVKIKNNDKKLEQDCQTLVEVCWALTSNSIFSFGDG